MPAQRIVVVGEGLLDVLEDADGHQTVRPGGAPVNVAVGLARQDVPVAWFGAAAHDDDGRLLRKHLLESGVSLGLVQGVDAPTTRAIGHLDDAGQAVWTFEVDGTTSLVPSVTPASMGAAVAVAMVCGAVTFTDAVLGTSMAVLIGTVWSPVWLDPNIRPSRIPDPVSYRKLLDSIVADVAVVKASVEDLAFLAREGETADDVAMAWARSGPALVVLTRGGEGLTAWRPRRGAHAPGRARPGEDLRRMDVPAVEVDVVDTVGAGDAIMASLMAWAHRRSVLGTQALLRVPEPALRLALEDAVTAASITCGRVGADPPTTDDLTTHL